MKSLTRKDISKLTAEKLNLDVDMVDDLMTSYYKQVSKKLSGIQHLHINLSGLGVSSVNKRRLGKLVDKQQKVVNRLIHQVDISMSRYSTLKTAEERLEALSSLQLELEEEHKARQEHKEKRYE